LDNRCVVLDRIYFGENVTAAAPEIDFIKNFFKGIFPTANKLEARFTGVKDPSVGRQERHSRNLWRNSKLGEYSKFSSSITMLLE